jgi:hypothetical protein
MLGEHLAQADRHIAEAEARIARQHRLIAGLNANGHDTSVAEALLATMEAVLRTGRDHRTTILWEIALEDGKPPCLDHGRPGLSPEVGPPSGNSAAQAVLVRDGRE